MSANSEYLPPVQSPQDFESLCLDLWRDIWGDPNAQKNGRSGQAQAGVDVFGVCDGKQMGVQCKQKDALTDKKMTIVVLEEAVKDAKEFKPSLSSFILATTAPRDAALQQRARELSVTSGFDISIWSWEDIWHELYQRSALMIRLRPIYWPLLSLFGQQRIGPPHLPRFASQLFGREAELQMLDQAWQDPKIHVVSLIAWGGVGKTSLVAHWADRLAERGYDGADYFEWSFYSQGTREYYSASADIFLDQALRHFGDEEKADSAASPRSKGRRLAEILGTRRALVILDGLEPLQYPPGPMAGHLRDDGMVALLRGLAMTNSGLCIITSREDVVTLARWHQSATPEWKLEHLSIGAGIQLLRSLAVKGNKKDLELAVGEVDGHALTLNLIGRFLTRAHGGDVLKRDRVTLYKADTRTESCGHAFRAIAAYERWLGEGDDVDNQRQLAVLRLLGLFDRPAPAHCLAALRAKPLIPGINELLIDLTEEDWRCLVSDLAECHLAATQGANLDAHPLIREYFARRMRNPDNDTKIPSLDISDTSGETTWREAHGRLFNLLEDSAAPQPSALADLQPLYQAIYHGCQAGREHESFNIYFDRISRGKNYASRQHGAYGSNLGAVACFFDRPWSQLSSRLDEFAKPRLLTEVSYLLRALGRLEEATEPLQALLTEFIQLEDWGQAEKIAGSLSQLEFILGKVGLAINNAERAVDFANRAEVPFARVSKRALLAYTNHQAGREDASSAFFITVKELQSIDAPESPLPNALNGFIYCDVLLTQAERAAGSGRNSCEYKLAGEFEEVERRANRALLVAQEQSWLVNIGIEYLSLGRATLYKALIQGTSQDLIKTQSEIEKAVAGLRSAGDLTHVPRGLITRAWLRSVLGDISGAHADLDEAQEIAERGSMRLHLADVALYRARLFHDREALAQARRLVEECGYGRRLPEIEDLEEMLGKPLDRKR